MSVVLDASLTVAWFFESERTPPVVAVLDLILESEAHVPTLWPLEVANALQVAARRGRMQLDARDGALRELEGMPISVAIDDARTTWGATLALADHHRLTVYDATYLELALRRGLPLATLDGALCAAAEAEGLVVLGR